MRSGWDRRWSAYLGCVVALVVSGATGCFNSHSRPLGVVGTGGTYGPVGTGGDYFPVGTGGGIAPAGTGGGIVPAGTGGEGGPAGTGGEVGPIGTGGAIVPRGTGGAIVPAGTGGAIVPPGTGGSGPKRVAIIPNSTGWVDKSTNDVGLQGQWFSYLPTAGPDGMPSTIQLTFDDQGVCITANIHRVEDVNGDGVIDTVDYADNWGVGFAFQLDNENGHEVAWSAFDHDATGYSFLVTGPAPPPHMYPEYVTSGGQDYCEIIQSTFGTYVIPWADARRGCFNVPPTPGGPDPTDLYRFSFIVPSDQWPTKFMSFNFCMHNIRIELR